MSNGKGVKVSFVIDPEKIPQVLAEKLSEGRRFCLGGVDVDSCLIISLVTTLNDEIIVLCRICPGEEQRHVVVVVKNYELAEAKAVQHLRREHAIFGSLWRYDENLTVHQIP